VAVFFFFFFFFFRLDPLDPPKAPSPLAPTCQFWAFQLWWRLRSYITPQQTASSPCRPPLLPMLCTSITPSFSLLASIPRTPRQSGTSAPKNKLACPGQNVAPVLYMSISVPSFSVTRENPLSGQLTLRAPHDHVFKCFLPLGP